MSAPALHKGQFTV